MIIIPCLIGIVLCFTKCLFNKFEVIAQISALNLSVSIKHLLISWSLKIINSFFLPKIFINHRNLSYKHQIPKNIQHLRENPLLLSFLNDSCEFIKKGILISRCKENLILIIQRQFLLCMLVVWTNLQ
jgi:hypothetical protein